MKCDLAIINGTVVFENAVEKKNIGINEGKICILTSDYIAAETQIDATGKVIMAGAIDGHVHFNDPGRCAWEDFRTGTQAAAFGGTTCIVDMPINSIPAVIDKNGFDAKLIAAKEKANIDYMFWGGLVDDNLSSLNELKECGSVGFKGFMSNSGVEFTSANDAMLLEGLKWTKTSGCFIGVHEENDAVTSYYAKKMKENGRVDLEAWIEARPPIQELEAINRFIFWTEHTGGNGHLCHVSVPEGFDQISQAQKRNVNITGELVAHYLWFTKEDYLAKGPMLKCAPPIREKEVKEELWKRVLDGKVDMITSDHSPCSYEEKAKGDNDIWKAWGGVSGVSNIMHVLLSEGYHKRGLSLSQITQMVSVNPAKRFSIYGKKGAIALGFDADLMIIDLDKEWVFDEKDIYTKNKYCPYVGSCFKGKVEKTIVRGRVVFDKKIIPCDGYGEYINRIVE